MKTKTALVIGGTGMLADLVTILANQYEVVGVVGRDRNKLNLLASHSERIVPIQGDYTETNNFKIVINEFTKHYGKPELLITWIHSTSPDISVLMADYCLGDLYEITGNGGKEPSHPSRISEAKIIDKDVRYHRVILGHMGDRWLTNQEISSGVYMAIEAKKDEYLVGDN